MVRTKGNGQGSIYQIKSGKNAGKWAAACSFVAPDGTPKRKVLTTRNKTEAEALLLKMRADLLQGKPLSNERRTVEHFVTEWLDLSCKPNVQESTYEKYKTTLDRHFLPDYGKKAIAKLSPQDIARYIKTKKAAGLSASTISDHFMLIKQILDKAVKWGVIPNNPARLVDAPRVRRPDPPVFDEEQGKRFVEAVRGHKLEAAFFLYIGLGMRRGEVLGLKWEDIDFEKKVIHIQRTLRYVGGKLTLTNTKTDDSEAALLLPKFIADGLLDYKRTQLQYKRQLGVEWKEHGLVFTSLHGGPIQPSLVAYHFQNILKAAKLPRLTLHGLRHSAGTILLAKGIPQKVVQAILRHRTMVMTNRYLHILQSMRQEAADVMDEAFG